MVQWLTKQQSILRPLVSKALEKLVLLPTAMDNQLLLVVPYQKLKHLLIGQEFFLIQMRIRITVMVAIIN